MNLHRGIGKSQSLRFIKCLQQKQWLLKKLNVEIYQLLNKYKKHSKVFFMSLSFQNSWKDPNNDFRTNLKITAVPTLLKYGTVSIFLQLCWGYNSPCQNTFNSFWIEIWKGLDISSKHYSAVQNAFVHLLWTIPINY